MRRNDLLFSSGKLTIRCYPRRQFLLIVSRMIGISLISLGILGRTWVSFLGWIKTRVQWYKVTFLFALSLPLLLYFASFLKKLLEHIFQLFLSSHTLLYLSHLFLSDFHQLPQELVASWRQIHRLSYTMIFLHQKYFLGVFTWAMGSFGQFQRRGLLRISDYFNTFNWSSWLNVGDSLMD